MSLVPLVLLIGQLQPTLLKSQFLPSLLINPLLQALLISQLQLTLLPLPNKGKKKKRTLSTLD